MLKSLNKVCIALDSGSEKGSFPWNSYEHGKEDVSTVANLKGKLRLISTPLSEAFLHVFDISVFIFFLSSTN